MRIDLQLDAGPDTAAVRARELAEAGADGLFTFEGAHDPFLPLALATTTTALPIMTNVAVALPRSPMHLAATASDLHRLSGGRFALGLGSQVRTHIERRYGSPWSRPADRMRETVAATREILTAWDERRAPSFRGEFTRHDFVPPMFMPAPLSWGRPPVLLGALGPRMTRVAGEVADGLLVMPFNSRRHILERTLPALRSGLAAAGRHASACEVVPQVFAALGSTEASLRPAITAARGLIAFYASTPAYRPVLEVEGRADLQPALADLVHGGDHRSLAGAIDDELLSAISVVGSPGDCAAQIAAKFAGVADRVCVYFPGARPGTDDLADLVTAVRAIGPANEDGRAGMTMR